MREGGDEKSTLWQIEKIKALSEDILEYQAIDVHRAWQGVGRRAKRKASMRVFSLFPARTAAVLVVPLLISSLFFPYLYYITGRNVRTGASAVFTEINSIPGTITRLVLPDQSTVWLSANNRLVYPSVFDERERKARFFDESYFEVKADPEHPFSVSTSKGLQVIACGTKFNVNTYNNEPFVEAVLEKGKVGVIWNDGRICPEPNEQVVLSKENGVFHVSVVSLDERMDRKEGWMVFRNALLEKVLERLEKRYNVETVSHKNSNAGYKYRTTFANETLEQILNYLEQTVPIEWSTR